MLKIVTYLILIEHNICYEEKSVESRNSLPNFRKQVEEITVDEKILTKTDDPNDNLVSFLVNNVKDIFGATEDKIVLNKPDTKKDKNTKTTLALRKTMATASSNKEIFSENVVTELGFDKQIVTNNINKRSQKNKTRKENKRKLINNTTVTALELIQRDIRSCILCNNVAVMECYDPQNKLIPTTVCEREEDLCYSQHTPFGIVDRGCLNVNYNLTTYVCSCNLCNHISISEMPYIFSTKKDWIEDVLELSRVRRLRHSILKDISCLRCEVNTSTKTGDMLDNANCLGGNIGLPIQECSENEICGVKAIKSDGYIWRGCVAKPLYNYWWTLCDSDLCNYDSLVSIYDEI